MPQQVYHISKSGESYTVRYRHGENWFSVKPNGDTDWDDGEHLMTLEEARLAAHRSEGQWRMLHP